MTEACEKDKLAVKEFMAKFTTGKIQSVLEAESSIRNQWLNCNNGSINCTKKRHQIVFSKFCGEAGSFCGKTVVDRFAKFKYLYDATTENKSGLLWFHYRQVSP